MNGQQEKKEHVEEKGAKWGHFEVNKARYIVDNRP